jgi:hypothetical protein
MGLRLVLGCVLIFASHDKLMGQSAFAVAIDRYQIVPPVLLNLTAIVFPWLELTVGVCLVSGVASAGAALVATILMCAFSAAILFALVRGLGISCGCWPGETAPIVWSDVIPRILLLLAAVDVLMWSDNLAWPAVRFTRRHESESTPGSDKPLASGM